MGTFPADSGSSIADCFGVLEAYGVCPESLLPYDADPAEAPNAAADAAAISYRIHSPCMVPIDHDGILSSLGSGRPVAFATRVTESFEHDTDAQGNIPAPSGLQLGSHALVALGADQHGPFGPNQWGTSWGDSGWWRMTWDFVATEWFEAWNAS